MGETTLPINKKSLISGSGKSTTNSSKPAGASINSKLTSEKLQAAQRLVAPKQANGMVAPKQANGLVAPKQANGLVAPKQANGLVAPKQANGLVAPKQAAGMVAPKILPQ
jgi:hypothetical protein